MNEEELQNKIENRLYEEDQFYTNEELENDCNNLLEECYPMYEMGNLKFRASEILEELDYIAYREEFLNFLDNNGYFEFSFYPDLYYNESDYYEVKEKIEEEEE